MEEEETYLSNSDKVEFVLLQMVQIIKFNKYPLSLYYVVRLHNPLQVPTIN